MWKEYLVSSPSHGSFLGNLDNRDRLIMLIMGTQKEPYSREVTTSKRDGPERRNMKCAPQVPKSPVLN